MQIQTESMASAAAHNLWSVLSVHGMFVLECCSVMVDEHGPEEGVEEGSKKRNLK